MNFEAVPAVLGAVAALLLGVLVGSRGPNRVANLAFACGMMGVAAAELGQLMLLTLEPGPSRTLWAQVIVGAEAVMMPAWAAFGATFASADQIASLRRWRWPLGLAAAASLVFLAMSRWQPFVIPLHPDPFGGRVLALTSLGKWAEIFSLVAAVFVLFHLESALRSSSGLSRRTVKYFLLGLLGVFGTHIFVLSQRLFYSALRVDHFAAESAIWFLSAGVMGLSLIRQRLLDVNLFISRHVVYRSVAVGVVGAYLMGLGLAGELTWRLGISPDFFLSALLTFVTAMALAAALLSDRVRRRFKRAIATNFYRHKYDFRQEWSEFTQKVASIENPDAVPSRILERVAETMGIQAGAIWLMEEEKENRWRLAASVGLPQQGFSLSIDPGLLVSATREERPVILLEGMPLAPNGGGPQWNRNLAVLVPLVAKGEVVGLLALGTPAGGRLTLEDEDLLATVAAQAATVIMNLRLFEQVARSREMEAFHRLSSFILHDLKNCVAMLSLVAQNAETHGSDPAFQKDVFITVAESVRQMRELIGKLSGAPKQLELVPRAADLNRVVGEVLHQARSAATRGVRISEELDDALGAVFAGDDAIRTVVSNLVLNAVEAIPGEGEVRVKTSRRNQTVTLMVADTGRGMSETFLRDGLFVPFKTTKSQGLGVGLYQVKSIVEGLGGRIRVESREGTGTTFWVDFPLAPGNGQETLPEMTRTR